MKPRDLITLEAAATILGVSRRTVERKIAAKVLRAFQQQSRTLVKKSDVVRLAEPRLK